MRKLLAVLALIILIIPACNIPTNPLSVIPATPVNGSTTQSLTPVMTWVSLGNYTYHLQIATDSGFQSLVVNETSLGQLLYDVPAGRLTSASTYFWRVRASKAGETGPWSAAWYFITPGSPTPSGTGTINIVTVYDGSAWSGAINYTLIGPTALTGSNSPQVFANLAPGTYTLSYNYGGPSGAVFERISPSPAQTLASGGSLQFTIYLRSQTAGSSIEVSATLNGQPWSGSLNYTISGPMTGLGSYVPKTASGLIPGTYTISYNSGGPSGAVLTSISPSATATLVSGRTLSFSLNFSSSGPTPGTSNAHINATLNGAAWSGGINYTLTHYAAGGPFHVNAYSVPLTITGLPTGNIQLSYESGGPSNSTLSSITPSAQQTATAGGTVYYTINFVTQQPSYGTITINATYDGAPWQTMIGSGGISFMLTGPNSHTSTSVPVSYSSQPTGTYTLNFNSGGPPGSVLESITPSHTQTLSLGGNIVYTLNFRGQEKGTVHVTATLNGQPWSGSVGYVVSGPYTTSGGLAPRSFTNAPAGTYSVSYSSGGPPSSVFEGVTPSSQILPAGGNIYFNLRFRFQGIPPPVP